MGYDSLALKMSGLKVLHQQHLPVATNGSLWLYQWMKKASLHMAQSSVDTHPRPAISQPGIMFRISHDRLSIKGQRAANIRMHSSLFVARQFLVKFSPLFLFLSQSLSQSLISLSLFLSLSLSLSLPPPGIYHTYYSTFPVVMGN